MSAPEENKTESKYVLKPDKGVNRISFDGSSDVVLKRVKTGLLVTSDRPVKCSQKGNELVIQSETSGSVVFFSGGSFSISGGSFSSISMSSGGVVDGVEIDLDQAKKSAVEKQRQTLPSVDSEYSTAWTVITESFISRAVSRGSGRLRLSSGILAGNVTLILTGSGGIGIANTNLHAADISLAGSGDIDLGASPVGIVKVSPTGSGYVKNFIATDFVLTGSGDITGSATKECEVNKEKTGSGDISIRRVGKPVSDTGMAVPTKTVAPADPATDGRAPVWSSSDPEHSYDEYGMQEE